MKMTIAELSISHKKLAHITRKDIKKRSDKAQGHKKGLKRSM